MADKMFSELIANDVKQVADIIEDGIGNNVFAIETALGSLKRRIDMNNSEVVEIVGSIERSLESAKGNIDVWKKLAYGEKG